jgi:Uma2 family endonuclease
MDTLQITNIDYAYLEGVSWHEYEALLAQAGERPIRFTYDNGRLEIMTLSFEHESYRTLIGRFIGIIAALLNIPMRSGGMNTIKQALVEKGLEPDACYWVQHEKHMRRKKRFELGVDPPPDLAVEVDVSRSVLNRLKIYEALRVPEVWRWRRSKLTVYILSEDGGYQLSKGSLAFPFLPLEQFERFVNSSETLAETTLVREFMAWVEKEIKPRLNAGRKNGKRGR